MAHYLLCISHGRIFGFAFTVCKMKLSVVARRLTVAAAAFAAISFGTGQAVATTFTFAFHGSTVSGFGTLYATDNGDGSFTATSGFGHETFGITTEDFVKIASLPNARKQVLKAS